MILILFATCLVNCAAASNEYYWKHYDPSQPDRFPKDAIVGGTGVSKENIYIGQTSIWPHAGIHTTTVVPGKEVWAPYGGAKQALSFIQILCGKHPERFIWISATSTTLHMVGINTHILHGGLDQNRVTYIGRVNHQGDMVIGKVYTHNILDSDMVYIFNKVEHRAKSFEVLTYNVTEEVKKVKHQEHI